MGQEEDKPPMTVSEMASMGGKARAKNLSKKRRKEIAKKAADARWGKQESKPQFDDSR
jgi:hypothetical protein